MDAYNSNRPYSAQQVGSLCIILPLHGFNYHLLAPLFNTAPYAILSKLHFTLYTSNDYAFNVRSWIVHQTPIPCSLFHFWPVARLPHYVWFPLVKVYVLAACSPYTWKYVPLVDMGRRKWPATYTQYFALGMQLPPALQSRFSFHLSAVVSVALSSACESKLVSRSSRKATVAKTVLIGYTLAIVGQA